MEPGRRYSAVARALPLAAALSLAVAPATTAQPPQPAPVAAAPATPAPSATNASQIGADRERFNDSLTQALMPVRFDDGRLGGAGGDWLAAALRTADVLMIGESHGTGSIAQAAGVLVDALPADRPLAYALEIGPAGAAIQEPLLRGPEGRLEAYMGDPRRAIAFPFLNLREEADLARKILARAGARQGALWGLDQEFAPSAPLLLDRLDDWARSPRQKAAIATARTQAKPLMALASAPDSFFATLDAAFASGPRPARQLIDDMRFSSQVYRLQDSAANLSNREREDYMKRNFLRHWQAAGRAKPRVVMKFGAYHLTAGLSPTATPALGSFVNAMALAQGSKTLSVLIVCGPDGEQIDFKGKVQPCTDDFEATAGLFRRRLYADSATLIDTAPLRLIPGTMRRLSIAEDLRNYIQSYDAIIVLRGARAATPFAPPPASLFQDM